MQLLGVKAVIANSFERIHRRNLAGMGVLPCQFRKGMDARSLALDGTELFDLLGLEAEIRPQQDLALIIKRRNGAVERVPLSLRLETAVEVVRRERRELVGMGAEGKSGQLRDFPGGAFGELRMGVEPGADRSTANG